MSGLYVPLDPQGLGLPGLHSTQHGFMKELGLMFLPWTRVGSPSLLTPASELAWANVCSTAHPSWPVLLPFQDAE